MVGLHRVSAYNDDALYRACIYIYIYTVCAVNVHSTCTRTRHHLLFTFIYGVLYAMFIELNYIYIYILLLVVFLSSCIYAIVQYNVYCVAAMVHSGLLVQ